MRSGGQPRASSQTVVEREQSLRSVRPASNSTIPHLNTTNADDAVQGKSSICHRGAAMECHGGNVSFQNKLIGPSTSVVFGSRRSATLRCGWMSGVICTREAAHGDVYADGGARDPSVRITRIKARGGCSSRLLEKSHVRRATAGSRVNLRYHAFYAKWVMCHAAVTVVLDRESAQDGVVAQPLHESLQVRKQRGTNNESDKETVKKQRVPPATTTARR